MNLDSDLDPSTTSLVKVLEKFSGVCLQALLSVDDVVHMAGPAWIKLGQAKPCVMHQGIQLNKLTFIIAERTCSH